ncbi:hypothetical protein [Schlesneria sp. T3-172]|uniref:hypothetical protein n=1 Tax=Schlesneria sphaerica TaxID=3373610 RepID=UPI0037C9D84B
MSEASLDNFEYISRHNAQFFRLVFEGVWKRRVMSYLICFGPTAGANAYLIDLADGWLQPWSDEIVKLNGLQHTPVVVKPWADNPELEIIQTTANACGAALLHVCWNIVFPDKPRDFPNWPNGILEYINDNFESLSKRVDNLTCLANYSEWTRLSANIDVERITLLDRIAVAGPRDGWNRGVKSTIATIDSDHLTSRGTISCDWLAISSERKPEFFRLIESEGGVRFGNRDTSDGDVVPTEIGVYEGEKRAGDNEPDRRKESPRPTVVKGDRPHIVLDKVPIPLTPEQAEYLDCLINSSERMTKGDYDNLVPGDNRPDRIIRSMPEEIQKRIDTHKTKGSKWV